MELNSELSYLKLLFWALILSFYFREYEWKALKNDLMDLELGMPAFQSVEWWIYLSAKKVSFYHFIHFFLYLFSAGAVEYKLFVGSLNKQASEKEVKEVCHNRVAEPSSSQYYCRMLSISTYFPFSFLSHQINYELWVCWALWSLFSLKFDLTYTVTWFLVVEVCMPWSS